MNCDRVQSMLFSFIDGELSGHELRVVREHVSRCPHCALELDEIRSIKTIIAEMPACEPSSDFEDRLVMSVLGPEPVEARRRGTLRWSAGLAACALFGAFATMGMIQHQRSQEVERQQEAIRLEVQRDQAMSAGMDPLSGRVGVVTANYAER
ncbi:MAG: zf-HC2 domain-containing protein [Fimbriimonadaceae bacterium]|nr:zf-HC2 domain-containing protein [Fimbriimonadaceae bacterium]